MGENRNESASAFLADCLTRGTADAILLPLEVPSGESFAWVLLSDPSLLDGALLTPPVMPVQGAKVLSDLTRRGGVDFRVIAVLRPCEIRAALELVKLNQINLSNVTLLSMDCPGAVPLSDYVNDPVTGRKRFENVLKTWGAEDARRACSGCTDFVGDSADLRFACAHSPDGQPLLISCSQKGSDLLEAMGLEANQSTDEWSARTRELRAIREKTRKQNRDAYADQLSGMGSFEAFYADCIDCHNCRTACPVCYCRQCYFDSEELKLPWDDYARRATSSGSVRFLPDTMLFHLGRMTHMSHLCVSCGACEDACPQSIEVAAMADLVAGRSQELFDYVPGSDPDQPNPLRVFRKDELHEVEYE